jgi:hypothetical protein
MGIQRDVVAIPDDVVDSFAIGCRGAGCEGVFNMNFSDRGVKGFFPKEFSGVGINALEKSFGAIG